MDKFALPQRNIVVILIGLLLMILGFILLAGGGSASPEEFSYEMFSTRRLTGAPLVIHAGIVGEIVGVVKVFRKRK